jgi:predicted nucleic acid-binding protein
MIVLLDTNVILDVLLKRTPFLEKSAIVLLLSEKKLIDGYVSASAITDIFFLPMQRIRINKRVWSLSKTC